MSWSHDFYSSNFFWLFILGIVVVSAISRTLRNNQREKTIRTAIEKGVTLDPATLNSLNPPRERNPQDVRAGLLTGSIVTFFVGCGLAAFGYVLSMNGNPRIFPVLCGVGALLWCISLGLFVSRLAVPRN